MKSFDSRTYSISDFNEWFKSDQLELAPRFQRRSVWTETARSYLMDTIIRGLPIPKVFIRQRIDPDTQKTMREVVDGQQRLRTILQYLDDAFVIRKSHNAEYGGMYFSQLPDDAQLTVLNYEITTDLLINLSDSEILDIFARLNAYAVVLNTQEKLNADHFGPFKQLADRLAHSNLEYWTVNRILRDSQILRMSDVTLSAELIIAMCEGIQSKKQLSHFYRSYENDFPYDTDSLAANFSSTLTAITAIYPEGLQASEFRRIHLFYSLFTSIYHLKYGLPGSDPSTANKWEDLKPQRIRNSLDHVNWIFKADSSELSKSDQQFLTDSRRATTDTSVRQRRTDYLLSLILDQ